MLCFIVISLVSNIIIIFKKRKKKQYFMIEIDEQNKIKFGQAL